jgi:Tol biopolymer transport system component
LPSILHISPDGSTLLVNEPRPALGNTGRIWLLPTNGGPARPLGDVEADFAAWSPDGKTIAFSQKEAIYLTEDEGATSQRLLDAGGSVQWIRWSPDGQRLRFSVYDPKTIVSSIWEARRDGKRAPVAMKFGALTNLCCGTWTRDGRHYLFREFRDQRTNYWVATESWSTFGSGKPYPLSGGGVEILAATPSPLDDTLFTVAHESSGLVFKFDLARRQLTPVLRELSVQVPDFSPDGKWMAICQQHTFESILWRVRSDGSEWLQLTDPKLFVNFARYSLDGKRIAMMAKWPHRPWKIYWVSAEGGALHELNVPITSQADPTWMPDNQSMLFGLPPRYFSEPETPRAIYIYNLQTESLSKVPGSEGWFSPRLSPDGRYLLALSIDEHRLGLYDFANSQWRVLLENPNEQIGAPFWSTDGNWAYVNYYGKNGSVLRIRVPDGVAQAVLSLSDIIALPGCFAWNTAPDGAIMITCSRFNSNIYALKYE